MCLSSEYYKNLEIYAKPYKNPQFIDFQSPWQPYLPTIMTCNMLTNIIIMIILKLYMLGYLSNITFIVNLSNEFVQDWWLLYCSASCEIGPVFLFVDYFL